jgi:hypothetical protein
MEYLEESPEDSDFFELIPDPEVTSSDVEYRMQTMMSRLFAQGRNSGCLIQEARG